MSRAAAWLDEIGQRELRPGPWTLDVIRELCARLGDPQLELATIHVAGTRGKGSTCAMIDVMLREAGHTCGLTTSPHLLSPCERIRVGGTDIDRHELDELASVVYRAGADLAPSYFEAMTAMAFLAFKRAGVRFGVIETGLGGRLDATNIVAPAVTAITRIGTDHADRLGATRAAIASEKAGIMKPGVPCVIAPCDDDVREVFEARGLEVATWLEVIDASAIERAPQVPLAGDGQRENAAVACAVLDALEKRVSNARVSAEDRARGLAKLRWRARLERIVGGLSTTPRVDILLDVAHDVEATALLARHLRGGAIPLAVVFSCLGDKDLPGIAAVLASSPELSAAPFLVPRLAGGRARAPSEVVAVLAGLGLKAHAVEGVGAALAEARTSLVPTASGEAPTLVAFGSFVLAGDVLRALSE